MGFFSDTIFLVLEFPFYSNFYVFHFSGEISYLFNCCKHVFISVTKYVYDSAFKILSADGKLSNSQIDFVWLFFPSKWVIFSWMFTCGFSMLLGQCHFFVCYRELGFCPLTLLFHLIVLVGSELGWIQTTHQCLYQHRSQMHF